ncbi:MAG: S-methyl-5-thioribose-1-phosphate isomerase [Candidatus Aenigmarchaeota archaeon]|nr:S-methyl-5-thioribose-1-phosphate isomerase [Candidatus Aenigmarchaeota archaeon]
MKVKKMMVGNKWYQSVWFSNNEVCLIDQTKLPFKFEIFKARNYVDVVKAIKTMIVRGASAIGVTAAYGIAQAFIQGNLEEAKEKIANARPTARDLRHAVEHMINFIQKRIEENGKVTKEEVIKEAESFANTTVENCKRIGKFGKRLIKDNTKIMTHCNAGWLASVDWGTVTSSIYMAKREGKDVFVYVSETRPRLQGARLTAWELYNENIKHAIICDNASAYFMHDVDIIIVGADRIARNGDIANKIGTLDKAILAKEYGVPFYVASSTNSFDFNCRTGKEIPIEQRSEEEVKFIDKKLIANKDSKALNPAFDVTPRKYIKGIITEFGIVKPSEMKDLVRRVRKMKKKLER